MKKSPGSPKKPPALQPADPTAPDGSEGSNAVEHEPDEKARPLPDGHHKYIPRSPFTAGNT